jgi:hypothetical protein
MVGTLIKSLGKHGIKFGLEDFQIFFIVYPFTRLLDSLDPIKNLAVNNLLFRDVVRCFNPGGQAVIWLA